MEGSSWRWRKKTEDFVGEMIMFGLCIIGLAGLPSDSFNTAYSLHRVVDSVSFVQWMLISFTWILWCCTPFPLTSPIVSLTFSVVWDANRFWTLYLVPFAKGFQTTPWYWRIVEVFSWEELGFRSIWKLLIAFLFCLWGYHFKIHFPFPLSSQIFFHLRLIVTLSRLGCIYFQGFHLKVCFAT